MAMTPEYVIVLTTLPAGAENDAFGRTLVEERLAACVNLLPPMESVYRWEGQVERDTERQLVIKTARDRVAALWDRIRELHPYETPEFVVLTISDGSEAYLRWIGGVDELRGTVKSVLSIERLPKVRDEVVHVFDPHRDSHQAVREPHGLTPFGGHRGVRHRGRV
jgi:periplasmic divalent cation tolerance protein